IQVRHSPLTLILRTGEMMKNTKDFAIEQVWLRYEQEKSQPVRNMLVEYYFPMVCSTAEYLCTKLFGKVEVGDLIGSGIFGLMDAIDRFDRLRGIKFETYCLPRIKGSMLDELRSMDHVPRMVRSNARRINQMISQCEARFGKGASDEETAGRLNMDINEFCQTRRHVSEMAMTSLDRQITISGSDSGMCQADITAGHRDESPPDKMQKRDLKQMLMKEMSRIEKQVIVLYYYEEMTMQEVGATLGMVESRVSQIHSAVIERLKTELKGRNYEFAAA
ncbi:MAG: FliA/WhiG family RNA polymerase sigma factor, partial [Sedimentisphaerales bacterium]|nr:FliA/WhiG family RNA polymerase sigma factor [Sedimentisphaerales bacterium]